MCSSEGSENDPPKNPFPTPLSSPSPVFLTRERLIGSDFVGQRSLLRVSGQEEERSKGRGEVGEEGEGLGARDGGGHFWGQEQTMWTTTVPI